VELEPGLPEAHKNWGRYLHFVEEKLEEAIVAYQRAIDLDPTYAFAHYALGNALSDQGKLEEAIASYEEAIRLNPDDASAYYASAYYGLGLALYDQGKLEQAMASYEEAIRLNPDSAIAHHGLGAVLYYQGKLEQAILSFEEAIHLNPDLASPYIGLGVAQGKQGNLDQAITLYQKALNLPNQNTSSADTHVFAHNNLGLAYQDQGRLEEAIEQFKRAIDLDPDFIYSENNLAEAERLLATPQIIALAETRYLPQDHPLTPIRRSVLQIQSIFPGRGYGSGGMGWVIKRRGDTAWIITNRHVIYDAEERLTPEEIQVELFYGDLPPRSRGETLTAQLLFHTEPDDILDLALLQVTGLPEDIQALELSPTPEADAVTVFRHNENWHLQPGNFLAMSSDQTTLTLEIDVAPGSSGGPVLNGNNQVLGIVYKEITVNQGLIHGYAHPLAAILQQLENWGVDSP
jgi:superkiller protein 3